MKQFILNYTDGDHIKQIGSYQSLSEAQEIMRQQYREHNPQEWSELYDREARIYQGDNSHIWSIATIDVPHTTYYGENNRLIVSLPDGHLVASFAQDPEYPGIDVEFIANTESNTILSRPRVLIEQPINEKLRCLIWNDPKNEDYTEEIDLQ